MRWLHAALDETRRVKRFLFLPKSLKRRSDGRMERRWLEMATIIQVCRSVKTPRGTWVTYWDDTYWEGCDET